MLGDAPDSTVTTTRFEFGGVSDAHVRGLCTVQSEIRPMCASVWLVLERSTKARGNAATTNGSKLYENMQMQCA